MIKKTIIVQIYSETGDEQNPWTPEEQTFIDQLNETVRLLPAHNYANTVTVKFEVVPDSTPDTTPVI